MKISHKRITAALSASILGLALSTTAIPAANANISGPVKCNQISAPANAQFFGAKNCYNIALVMTIQYRGGGVKHVCVQPKKILWTDQSAFNIQLGMLYSSRLSPHISLVRC